MQYVRLVFDNGYCGCEEENYLAFDDECTEKDINAYAQENLQDYAESYAHVATGWDNDFEDEEDEVYYYESCYYDWDFISKEEWEENNGETV
jgi:hypothetical protein